MSSHCLKLLLPGCQREERDFSQPPERVELIDSIRLSDLRPGPETAPNPPAVNPAYQESAYAIAEGHRLYSWYNCVGCHFHGGGGIGPPLMDEQWIYGSQPENIHATIIQGRPNGMPSFGGRIPDYQVWQLAAFVRSLSGLTPKDAAPARSDHMGTEMSPASVPKQAPKITGTPP